MPRQPLLPRPVQRADALRQRDRRRRPVDQRQIDCVEPELVQSVLQRRLKRTVAGLVRPYLRGDENRVSQDPSGAESGADPGLVAVHCRRVDMPVASRKRCSNHALRRRVIQRPGAETDRRNARSTSFDEVHAVVSAVSVESLAGIAGAVERQGLRRADASVRSVLLTLACTVRPRRLERRKPPAREPYKLVI